MSVCFYQAEPWHESIHQDLNAGPTRWFSEDMAKKEGKKKINQQIRMTGACPSISL
jgi:hypothetical protein